MAQRQNHIVNRFKIELRVSSPEQGHEMQEQISQVVEQKLEAMFDDLFRDIPADKTIVVDRLQFDLGAISTTKLQARFLDKLQQQIEEKLPDLVQMNTDPEQGIQRLSKKELYWQTLRHYLLTGTYPWFVANETDDDILKDPAELFETMLENRATTVADFLNTNGDDPNVRTRIIALLDNRQFNRLRKKVLAGGEGYQAIRGVLLKIGAAPSLIETGLKNVQLALLGQKSVNVDQLKLFFKPFLDQDKIKQFFHRSVKYIEEVKYMPNSILGLSIKEIIALNFLSEALDESYNLAALDISLSDFSDSEKIGQYINKIKGQKLPAREIAELKEEIDQQIAAKLGMGKKGTSVDNQKPKSQGEESFYISNGGLVLLWPFLPKFFRSLELTAERQFIDQESQVKAMHILQYLASGERSTFEYLMVFNKVLCGYPLERPFSAKVDFSDHDIAEADDLLKSTVDQWAVLKNTSVEGLRQGFIQRNARLTEEPDQWKLQVEHAGYDMLLDKLPWGISVARLPWMEKPIYVNWR